MANEQLNILETSEEKNTKAKSNKKEKAKTKKVEKEEKKFKAPFGFAFGPQRLNEVPGAVNENEYSLKEIKELLVNIGINELRAPDASLHYIEDENIFVLTNILQKKGAGTISAGSLNKIEAHFLATYIANKTEDRALVYKNVHSGKEKVCFPENKKTLASLEGSPEMYFKNNLDWPLHADLHSHHVLGGTPSKTDDENEQVRGVIFGIAFWNNNQTNIMWNLRKWTGERFELLNNDEVIQHV